MEWFNEHAWESWLALSVVLALAELLSLDLVLLMLALGALAGMVAALLGAPVVAQAIAAGAVALLALLLARPSLVRRFHGGPELTLGHGKLLGQQGVVTEQISGSSVGRVRLAGEIWTAVAYDETATIEPGEPVEVMEIRGATAVVHPVAHPLP